ncbi:MAG: NAD(P)/FAD-dependent oxidoreductase [Candidatus Heimdallarchaeaceae archaeon]
MVETEVAIVGAGPAGLQAAISLVEENIDVIVFEEHDIIGQPIQCGEGISYNALQDFNLINDMDKFVAKEFNDCYLFFPGSSLVKGDIHAFTIYRDRFDQYLANIASKNGARILTSSKVIKVHKKSDSFDIYIENFSEEKKFESKILILGEGVQAKISQTLGFSPPYPTIKAFEYKIEGEWSDSLEFYFDSMKFPNGYCWVFPKKKETNIGIVTTSRNRKALLDNFLKEKGIDGKIIKKIGGQIPMKGPIKKLYGDRVLVVGDTAGMTNPIFYGGIRLGMTSGFIAAKVVARNLVRLKDRKKMNLEEYQKELNRYSFMKNINLKGHHFLYSRTNSFLEKLGVTFNQQYINRIKAGDIIKILKKMLFKPEVYKNPLGLFYFYKSFKIARDWGF